MWLRVIVQRRGNLIFLTSFLPSFPTSPYCFPFPAFPFLLTHFSLSCVIYSHFSFSQYTVFPFHFISLSFPFSSRLISFSISFSSFPFSLRLLSLSVLLSLFFVFIHYSLLFTVSLPFVV